MRSPPLTYSMTKYTRVSVWKHECKPRRKGCRSRAAAKNTRFSERVLYQKRKYVKCSEFARGSNHLSTSSLSIMNSFLSTLMAYKLFVFFSSASMTLPKFPFPSTARKLKSSNPTLRLRVACLTGCWGRCCNCIEAWDWLGGRAPGRSCEVLWAAIGRGFVGKMGWDGGGRYQMSIQIQV